MSVLGIDPGAKGGMVLLEPVGTRLPPQVYKFADRTPFDIVQQVSVWARDVQLVVLEEVGARPGEGASRAFSQGRNFGQIESAALGVCERLILVKPNAWQRALGCPTTRKVPKPANPTPDALKLHKQAKARAKRDHKNDLKAMAQRLFPREKVTLDTCDAFLLAHYALTIELPKLRGESA